MMKFIMYLIMLIFLIFINKIYLMIFMFNLLMILCFLFLFNNNNNFWFNIYSWMGMDFISYILIFLSILIISLMFISSLNFKNNKFYTFILLTLLMFLYLSFCSMNYFLFYLFFEISLIPTFILIMGWGYQPERINASMYMLLYTLFASLPLLILLFYIYLVKGSLNYNFLLSNFLSINLGKFLIYFFMIFAFLVKLPLFMFHLWLPKAHIEAPVTGSMILAAVLLKLGGYGCYRSMMMMMNLCKKFNFLFIGFSLFGMIYLSMISMRCNDLKLIIAYSSVVHMGMMFMGLISLTLVGFIGGFIMMIGHGFCSSALFYMLNCFYSRIKSRNLLFIKGLIIYFPNLIMWWFLFSVMNMAAPISLNLLSEILILMSVLDWLLILFFFLGVAMYFSAMYSLFMYSYVSHGCQNNLLLKFNFVKISEYLIILIHWIPLNFLILKCDLLF